METRQKYHREQILLDAYQLFDALLPGDLLHSPRMRMANSNKWRTKPDRKTRWSIALRLWNFYDNSKGDNFTDLHHRLTTEGVICVRSQGGGRTQRRSFCGDEQRLNAYSKQIPLCQKTHVLCVCGPWSLLCAYTLGKALDRDHILQMKHRIIEYRYTFILCAHGIYLTIRLLNA